MMTKTLPMMQMFIGRLCAFYKTTRIFTTTKDYVFNKDDMCIIICVCEGDVTYDTHVLTKFGMIKINRLSDVIEMS